MTEPIQNSKCLINSIIYQNSMLLTCFNSFTIETYYIQFLVYSWL